MPISIDSWSEAALQSLLFPRSLSPLRMSSLVCGRSPNWWEIRELLRRWWGNFVHVELKSCCAVPRSRVRVASLKCWPNKESTLRYSAVQSSSGLV